MAISEVDTAFDILLEEVEDAINQFRKEAKQALDDQEYEKARQAIDKADRLEELRKKIKGLQKEWSSLLSQRVRHSKKGKKGRRKAVERLPRGLRTPENAFRRPILETLLELGGEAPAREVLKRVREKLKDQLTPHDYELLPSDGRTPRWRNTAQWCRATLVEEGLMRADTQSGIWAISEAGRQWLVQYKEEKGQEQLT